MSCVRKNKIILRRFIIIRGSGSSKNFLMHCVVVFQFLEMQKKFILLYGIIFIYCFHDEIAALLEISVLCCQCCVRSLYAA